MPKRVTIPGVGTVNFPDDMPDDQVHAESEKLYAQSQASAPKPAAAEPADANPPAGEWGHAPTWGDVATAAIPVYGPLKLAGMAKREALPALGGLVGGITGGAGLIPAALAAGAGGGLGSVAKNAIEYFQGARKSPTDVATDVATDAALQGGAQLAGGALAKGAGMAGRGLYKFALNPSKVLQKEFPTLAQTAIDEGINVTKAGEDAAKAAKMASREEAKAIIDTASPTAEPIRAKEVADAFRPAYEKLKGARSIGKDVSAESAAVRARARAVAESFGGTPATPATPDRIVRLASSHTPLVETGDEAVMRANAQLGPLAETVPSRVLMPTEPEVRAARQLGATATTIPNRVLNGAPAAREPLEFVSPGTPGTPAQPGGISLATANARKAAAQDASDAAYKAAQRGAPVNDLEDLIDKNLAQKYREAIEARVPEVAGVNARTQRLMGLERAISDANLRPQNMRWWLSIPSGGLSVLSSPPVAGRAGLALGRMGGGQGQIPANALRAALLNLMGQEQAQP